MQNVLAPQPIPGRVIIEIARRNGEGFQVTMRRTCDKPDLVQLSEAVLEEIARLSPGVLVRTGSSESSTVRAETIGRRRGGPAGTPEDQRLRVVRGWLGVQGKIKQEAYARAQGVAPSTLRRWISELRKKGKL